MTDEVAGEEKVLNGGVFQLSSGWVVLMVLLPLSLSVCTQDLVAATEACEEVLNSDRFRQLLELVLLMGNYLNTGSRNAQSIGFDISFLPKVRGCL